MKTLEAWEKYQRGKVLKPKSISNMELSVRYLAEFEPELPMSRVLLNEWAVWLSKTKHQSSLSVRHHVGNIKSLYSYLQRTYEWDKNPAKDMETITHVPQPRRYWTIDELSAIFQACKTDVEKVLIGALLDSSARIHELASLPVANVADTSFKCAADSKTGSHVYRCQPAICAAMRRIAGNTPYVFPKHNGQPQSAAQLGITVRRIVTRAGITGTKIGPHTFRHTAASLVAAESNSILAVQAVTGHAKMDMAQHYIHDVNQSIAQRYSPMEIAGRTMHGQDTTESQTALAIMPSRQPAIQAPTEIVINADGTPLASGANWLEDMFKTTPETMVIRPRLYKHELDLIRHALQLVVEHSPRIGADVQARDLWNRMLRKA